MRLFSLLFFISSMAFGSGFSSLNTAPDYRPYFFQLSEDSPTRLVTKFGRNPDVDVADAPEDVWDFGGIYTGQTSVAVQTVSISSGSTLDTSGGTGARTIRIVGLADGGSQQSEDVTLNGTGVVNTTNSWSRIFRAFVLTAGTLGWNAGDITINYSDGADEIYARIPATYGQTQIGAGTVPTGEKYRVSRLVFTSATTGGAVGSAVVSFAIRTDGGAWRRIRTYTLNNATLEVDEDFDITLEPLTDYKCQVVEVSSNNTDVSCSVHFIVSPI